MILRKAVITQYPAVTSVCFCMQVLAGPSKFHLREGLAGTMKIVVYMESAQAYMIMIIIHLAI